MKRLLGAFVLAVSSCASWGQTPHFPMEHLLWKGNAIPFYGQSSSPESKRLLELLQRSNMAERMAYFAQTKFRLRNNLAVGFQDCGNANAFYKPANHAVVICNEFVRHVANVMSERKALFEQQSPQTVVQWLTSVLWFVYLHELGHALIDIDQVAITGREEDVADQFAVWASISYAGDLGVAAFVPGIWYFQEVSTSQRISDLPPEALVHLLSDEHSLQGQRALNFACWVYGYNPQAGQELTGFVSLSSARKERCPSEYRALDNGIRSQFRKALRATN